VPRSSVASSAPEAPLALVGPTATGKTAVAILLAERLGAEIVGCDSRQVYRGLAVGSAQPTAEERARVPHHLVDAVDPRERYSAARYRDAVHALLPGIAARGRVALFVGGTGLYLRAALEGLCAAPPAAPALRRWLAALGRSLPGGLHPLLASVDPAAAARVHPHDTYRQIRALEVFQLSGRPLSEHHGRQRDARRPLPARVFAIDLDGAAIRTRIARRLEAMLAGGLLEEARALFEAGLDPTLPALRAVGYPELFAHLRGEASLDEALEHLRRSTWQYARRQLTWFRAVPGVTWVRADADTPADELAAAVQARLAAPPEAA
jgi:tRNA dimethylallyltransferase